MRVVYSKKVSFASVIGLLWNGLGLQVFWHRGFFGAKTFLLVRTNSSVAFTSQQLYRLSYLRFVLEQKWKLKSTYTMELVHTIRSKYIILDKFQDKRNYYCKITYTEISTYNIRCNVGNNYMLRSTNFQCLVLDFFLKKYRISQWFLPAKDLQIKKMISDYSESFCEPVGAIYQIRSYFCIIKTLALLPQDILQYINE